MSDIHTPDSPHALSARDVLGALATAQEGLSAADAASRKAAFGANQLPDTPPPTFLQIVLRQFAGAFIVVLVVAGVLSLALQEWADAAIIAAVLVLNAVIGAFQEHGAERAAAALRAMVVPRATVRRAGVVKEIPAADLVPGDVLLLEAGLRVPADARLLEAHGLESDESLLTGESMPVRKDASAVHTAAASLGDRSNMVWAGATLPRGRGVAVVVATGGATQLGQIATSVMEGERAPPPLLIRMEQFTKVVAAVVAVVVLVLAAVVFLRGGTLQDVLMLSVAMAVSAIPEGLPIALTVALAIGARRMSRRGVIARRLVAVESLGSCTVVASDKTGTLTMNELSVRAAVLPGEQARRAEDAPFAADDALSSLALAGALCNDATLREEDGAQVSQGDAVDVALLAFADAVGLDRAALASQWHRRAELPFEAERRYAATIHESPQGARLSVKGAGEVVLPMCSTMLTSAGPVPVDADALLRAADALAADGFRVLAVASAADPSEPLTHDGLHGLVFEGFVGMIDPLRPEVPDAVAACRGAGIEVLMITGDHPVTALAISRRLGIAQGDEDAVTGAALRGAASEAELDALVRGRHVFARVEPDQKLQVVHALLRQGELVAVTGDGANDAPALRAANLGVAMGERGTDIAREASDLILTDDNFSSIVAGIEEGRLAFRNVRKVIFLLVSTGAAELMLFTATILAGLPLPLLPAQILFLNLVTNGVQDKALAFEPSEGDELQQPPRAPDAPIIDARMIERLLLSGVVMAGVTFFAFRWMLDAGWTEAAARNGVLLIFVLFQNVQAGNARTEGRSVLTLLPWSNPVLLAGTLAAQGIYLLATVTPGVRDVLELTPPSFGQWVVAGGLALILLAAVEIHKALRPPVRGRRAQP